MFIVEHFLVDAFTFWVFLTCTISMIFFNYCFVDFFCFAHGNKFYIGIQNIEHVSFDFTSLAINLLKLCRAFSHIVTAWKVSKYGDFSGLYFPVFGLNTEKYGSEKTPYLDTFNVVSANLIPSILKKFVNWPQNNSYNSGKSSFKCFDPLTFESYFSALHLQSWTNCTPDAAPGRARAWKTSRGVHLAV